MTVLHSSFSRHKEVLRLKSPSLYVAFKASVKLALGILAKRSDQVSLKLISKCDFTIRGSQMKPNWQKLASLAQEI